MMRTNIRSIALLKPGHPRLADILGSADRNDEWKEGPDIMRETTTRIRELSDEMGLEIIFNEYHLRDNRTPVPKVSREIQRANLVAVMEPDDHLIAYLMACMRENPVMSVLLEYADEEYMDRLLELIGTQCCSIIGETKPSGRIFPLHTNGRDNDMKLRSIRKALTFPYAA